LIDQEARLKLISAPQVRCLI